MVKSLFFAVFLAGCAGLTNGSFDQIEYSRYADITTASKILAHHCDKPDIVVAGLRSLSDLATYAVGYSNQKTTNMHITAASKELQSLINEAVARYDKQSPSVGYCQLKLAEISTGAESIATSIAKKEK